jgi:hypothetical protein
MKVKALILALFVAGTIASAALADKPVSPPGQAKKDAPVVSTDTSTDTSTVVTHGKSTSVHGNANSLAHTPNKVLVCKVTGSATHPYVLVRVAPKAAAKMLENPFNVLPDANNACPLVNPRLAPTTTDTTTTV